MSQSPVLEKKREGGRERERRLSKRKMQYAIDGFDSVVLIEKIRQRFLKPRWFSLDDLKTLGTDGHSNMLCVRMGRMWPSQM